MADIIEVSNWETVIDRKETTTPVLGGDSNTPANLATKQLANRTQWIKDTLEENSIYIDHGDYKSIGQNFIHDVEFDVSVSQGDFVYYNEAVNLYYRAIAGDTGRASKPVGTADIPNFRVITGGVVQINIFSDSKNKIYLSAVSAGQPTEIDTGVNLGYIILDGIMKLDIKDYIHSDPIASIPGLRTLGDGVSQACSGDDPRLIHSGDVTSIANGNTSINPSTVTEDKQLLSNVTIHNFSTSMHGYTPKAPVTSPEEYILRGDGAWAYGYVVPPGVIVMWSGLLINVPSGWYFCNGTNGTPDLRDRFILGTTTQSDMGVTGGTNSAHTHTVGGHAISIDEMPSHTHEIGVWAPGGHPAQLARTAINEASPNPIDTGETGGGAEHVHPLSSTFHLPNYYKIAYIMKG